MRLETAHPQWKNLFLFKFNAPPSLPPSRRAAVSESELGDLGLVLVHTAGSHITMAVVWHVSR